MSVVKLSVVKTGQLSSGPVLSYLIEVGASSPCLLLRRLTSQHPSGKNLVYGLGLKSDLSSYPPATQAEIKAAAAIGPNVDLAWRLEEAERERPTIAATVLPSTHWTHIGAPLHFLPSSEVVIGQGVLATLPGYPVNESATFLHLDLPEKARTVREVSGAAVAGSRTGVDYFGDGSVLVLNGEVSGWEDEKGEGWESS